MAVIALDFDDTITKCPDMMSVWTKIAQFRGHRVICVTCRTGHEDNIEMVESYLKQSGMEIPVYFTSLAPKRDYMERQGVKVDIWVDDLPESIERGR